MKKAYLVMENGRVFEGLAFGAEKSALGETVFTTGMGGYIETLTDPSYFGQIVVQTFPMSGNYGMISADWESRGAFLKGYVVREHCDFPSNFRSESTLDEALKKWGVPGICGVDTREITRTIRDAGEMNAMIVSSPEEADPEALRAYRVRGAVDSVTCGGISIYPVKDKRKLVAVYDLGMKRGMIEALNARGCEVCAFPASAAPEAILSSNPDGILVTNGPGDPMENERVIKTVGALVGKKPLMGICLGHQIAALAMGGGRVKMKFGHRGANQPVKFLETGRVFITAQNHGYAIDKLPSGARMLMTNANDDSCEGISYPDLGAFTVQFHPEARSGPHDTGFLFDEFIGMMGGESNAKG